jgi:replication-associated recombination protein RarA
MRYFTPTSTAEMVFSNTETKQLLEDILCHNISFPSHGKNCLILFGVHGSGKTTYSKIFFDEYEKSYNGDEALVKEINVESNEKITTTIDTLNNIADLITLHNHSDKHYFMFDEFDNLKEEQQTRLKHFLNRQNIICIMTTNNLHKIDRGIQSRSHLINCNASSNINDYVVRMRQILAQNNLPLLDVVTLKSIANQSNGSWREMGNLLEQCCSRVNTKFVKKPKLRLI